MKTDKAEIEKLIDDWFEANYETMKSESGHALAPDVKEAAKKQVLLYWKKLHNIAESITETEVHLSLPQQKTPKGRIFNIEGIVDIIRKKDTTEMYDIKTHDAEAVRSNWAFYEEQLNVYAHIWQNLHGEKLDFAAIITTRFPSSARQALRENNKEEYNRIISAWNPIIRIPFDTTKLAATICNFGEIVDHIEERKFSPPEAAILQERKGSKAFATRVCRNCDARHSCSSYRVFAKAPSRRDSIKFSEFYNDNASNEESSDWLDANMETEEKSRNL